MYAAAAVTVDMYNIIMAISLAAGHYVHYHSELKVQRSLKSRILLIFFFNY